MTTLSLRKIGVVIGLALSLMGAGVGLGHAQTVTQATPTKTGSGAGAAKAPAPADLDYKSWEKIADRAENTLADPATDSTTIDDLRAQIADWRQAFQVSQNANSARIATLRDQIAALGPVPADGATEADEITQRRQELSDQLIKLQAPGLAADEAYRRADGLIGEIDQIQRTRQTDQLLQLWPAPVYPATWPAAFAGLSSLAVTLWQEVASGWDRRAARGGLYDNLPLTVVLLSVGLAILWRGPRAMARIAPHIPRPAQMRARHLVDLGLSLATILLPTLGITLLAAGLRLMKLTGPVGGAGLSALPMAGLAVFAANWLAARVFPADEAFASAIPLSPERRAEGRVLASSLGLLIGLETLRQIVMLQAAVDEATVAVLVFPILVAVAFVVLRMGQLLWRETAADPLAEDGPSFADRVLGILGRAAVVAGSVGPLLAAVGYVQAGAAIVYPAALSLGLVAFLFVLQGVVADIYGLFAKAEGNEGDGADGLIPVLIGFAMTLGSLPVFALIWGARWSDLSELWQRFLAGFQIGDTRISPTDFVVFAVIFAGGYALTRLIQGALKASVLPRTSLDPGGQTAVVSGLGYVGIILSALIAINFAGIDLSGLAIVAGALSVGIGFGLQNIVSNFVSGIILLIERPVSEGDWIEVGGVQGTVKSISVRSTRIQTFDRTDVIVPNSDLVSGRVTNWTRFNLTGRLILQVSVAYGTDTRHVERVLREIAEAQPLVVLKPAPLVVFMGLGADAMNFELRVILRDVNFSLQVRSEINHQIIQRFAEEGIEIPFAQTEVTLRNADELLRALRGLPEVPAS